MKNKKFTRTKIKEISDYILNPLGLSLERFFGRNLELKKIIEIANKLEVDLLLDIGANRGQYAEKMIESGFYKNILSFEPLSDAHEVLNKKAHQQKNWKVYAKCAVGDSDGFSEINIANNEYSSSLLVVNEKHLSIAPEAASKHSEKVKLIKLDSISEDIYGDNIFIKIDTQGFEDKVLLGASEKILRRTKLIQLELSLLELYTGGLTIDKMIPLLEKYNFEPLFFSPGFNDRATNEIQQLDGFFIRNDCKY